jgi:hypothetical protein
MKGVYQLLAMVGRRGQGCTWLDKRKKNKWTAMKSCFLKIGENEKKLLAETAKIKMMKSVNKFDVCRTSIFCTSFLCVPGLPDFS